MNTKQVILVRNDLDMSPGKACAQVGHASLLFLAESVHRALKGEKFKLAPNAIGWLLESRTNAGNSVSVFGGMKKIVLGVSDVSEMWSYIRAARARGLETHVVFDEGLNAETCAVIGPDDEDVIDKVTGKLKLYGPKEDYAKFDEAIYKAVKRARAEEIAEKTYIINPLGDRVYSRPNKVPRPF